MREAGRVEFRSIIGEKRSPTISIPSVKGQISDSNKSRISPWRSLIPARRAQPLAIIRSGSSETCTT